MADRKEWELTHEEMNTIWQGGHEYYAPGKIATAAARKALEWAAFGPCRDEREVGQAEKTIIRELSDG